MKRAKLIANLTVALFVIFAFYIKYIEHLGLVESGTGYDFFDLPMIGKFLAALLNIFFIATIFIAVKHAFINREYFWAFINLLFFPAIYYIYYKV